MIDESEDIRYNSHLRYVECVSEIMVRIVSIISPDILHKSGHRTTRDGEFLQQTQFSEHSHGQSHQRGLFVMKNVE